MTTDRIQSTAQKLKTLKSLDVKLSVFGSSTHRYASLQTTDIENEALQQQHWPEDYVAFLHLVGSGAGPYYGVRKPSFEDIEEVWLLNEPVEEGEVDSDDETTRLMIAAGATRNTIIPICDYGCGERFMLAVAGPRKGSLWYDYGFGDNSIRPLATSFLDFYERWIDHSLSQFFQQQEQT